MIVAIIVAGLITLAAFALGLKILADCFYWGIAGDIAEYVLIGIGVALVALMLLGLWALVLS